MADKLKKFFNNPFVQTVRDYRIIQRRLFAFGNCSDGRK